MNKILSTLFFGGLALTPFHSEGAVPASKKFSNSQYDQAFEFVIPKDLSPVGWKVAHRYDNGKGNFVIEYIPSGETLENWSEMITVQYFSYAFLKSGPSSAGQFANKIRLTIEKQYNNVNWKVLDKTPESITVEWKFPHGVGGHPPEYDIMKMVTTDKGLHQISYATRVTKMDPEQRLKWIDFIKGANVVKSST